MPKSLLRTPTGITGFDEILGGGFPQGRVLLVLGEPGSGKTIFCSQFLINGINKFGESGLLVSMEESRTQYEEEMDQLGWDFASLEKEGKFSFVDASPIRGEATPGDVKIGRLTIGRQDFSLINLLELVRKNVEAIGAKRIVVDPVSSLIFQYPDETERRKALLELVEAMSKTGATCILSSELRRIGLKGRILQTEEYLVHGVVLMQTIQSGRTMERVIQVEKMRVTSMDRQPHPYRITEKGIEVYPREMVL